MDSATRSAQSSSQQPAAHWRLDISALLVILLFSTCLAKAQTPTPTPPTAFKIEHFLCYEVFPPQFNFGKNLSILDQFNKKPLPIHLKARDLLCNPVAKNGKEIGNKEAHLVGYPVSLPPEQKPLNIPVVILNQFNDEKPQRALVLHPLRLLLPTGKARQTDPDKPPETPPIPTFDHYFCYSVKAEEPLQQNPVTIQDQFDEETTRKAAILGLQVLCNPAEKLVDGRSEGPILNGSDHLACYNVNILGNQVPPEIVLIHNQFEKKAIRAVRPVLLCLPSKKKEGVRK